MPPDSRPMILLLSSDLRRRYAEDILTALALPEGALIQFRYGAEYVSPALQQRIASRSIMADECIIGFVSGIDSVDRFFLPVRLAKIVSAECVADIFVLQLQVKEYSNVEDWPLGEAELGQHGAQLINKIVESNTKFYPATSKFPDLHVTGGGDQAQLWLGVVRRLARHTTFTESYFVRIDSPSIRDKQVMAFDRDGQLALTERQSARLTVSLYSEQYSQDRKTTLRCSTDERHLRVSSDDTYDVALRYDTVEFWLQPNAASFDALARVSLNLGSAEPKAPDDRSLATHVQIPVVVRRSRSTLVARVVMSAVGAFLVAFPAILGQHSPIQARILSAIAGAMLIAFGAIVIPRI